VAKLRNPLRASGLRVGIFVQATLVVAAGLIALSPPARGVVLMVPVTPGDGGRLLRFATDANARILGRGPVRGSLLVLTDRPMLLRAATQGIAAIRGSYFGCGL
jgi:hypothetical protein